MASLVGHVEVIKVLAEAGVDINEPDIDGDTAAHILTDLKSLRVGFLSAKQTL